MGGTFKECVDKEAFDKAVERALVDAINVYIKKGENRDYNWSMADKMAFKPQSFITFIYMKACRMVQAARKYWGGGCLNEWSLIDVIQEETMDIMVYCAGLLAYLACIREEAK